jgi:hypothetical protein
MENWCAAGEIASRALVDLPNSMRSSPVFNGPGIADGAIYAAICTENLQKRIATPLRFVLLVHPSPFAECVLVRGMAFRGKIDSDSLHLTVPLIEKNDLREFSEVIWNEAFDPIALAAAIDSWILNILTIYFRETDEIYQQRMIEEVQVRDARLLGKSASTSERHRSQLVAFTSSTHRPVKDSFPRLV